MPEVEQTQSQIADAAIVSYTTSGKPMLTARMPATYNTYRALRKDPTIALAREISVAPILSGAWSVEADSDVSPEMVDYVSKYILPLRDALMGSALFYGRCDYGWQAFEKVWKEQDGYVLLEKAKPLLPDLTDILVEARTGAFAGLYQEINGVPISLDTDKSFVLSFNVEGTNWYGQGLLENVRATQTKWEACEDGATRYDEKVAGSHFVLQYPPGVSTVANEEKPNSEVAKDVLDALVASGSIILPRAKTDIADPAAEFKQWSVDILADGSARQYSFVARLSYLDKLKVRAMLMPERSVLEGQFGTKAETAEQTDLAFTVMELVDRMLAGEVNKHIVSQAIRTNFGPEVVGKVRIVPAPLVDKNLEFLRVVYGEMLKNPATMLQEFGEMDQESMRAKLGIPTSATVTYEDAVENEAKGELTDFIDENTDN